MECLENIVGLIGVCDQGNHLCYINDEIPLKLFSKLANEEDINGKGLFERLRKKACENVADDFKDALMNCGYHWDEVIQSEVRGGWSKNSKCVEDSRFEIEIYKDCTDPYITPQVCTVAVKAKTETIATLTTTKGKESTTEEITLTCGENIFEIDYDGDVSIAIEGELSLYSAISCSCTSTCNCGSCYAIKGDSVFQVSVSCVCLDETLICKYKKQLKQALKLNLTACFWEEFEGTCRKNEVARGLEEDAQIKYARIMGGDSQAFPDKIERKDSKYWPKIWNAAKRVKGSLRQSKCLKCRGYRYVEQI